MTDVTIIFMNRIENRSEYLASLYFDKYLRVLIVVKYLPSKKEWMKRITTTLFRHKQFINNIKMKKGVGIFSQYHHPYFSAFFQTRTVSSKICIHSYTSDYIMHFRPVQELFFSIKLFSYKASPKWVDVK